MIGAGYEFLLGRRFSLVPELTYTYGRPGDIELDHETQFSNWRHNIVSLKIGFVFHRTRR